MGLKEWLKGLKGNEVKIKKDPGLDIPQDEGITFDQKLNMIKQMKDPRWLKMLQDADEADAANFRR